MLTKKRKRHDKWYHFKAFLNIVESPLENMAWKDVYLSENVDFLVFLFIALSESILTS